MKNNLTERGIEILYLMQEGFITKEVAGLLKISVRTVETHRRNINEKLGVRNVTAALRRARHMNVLV